MTRYIKDLRPTNIQDIMAMVALSVRARWQHSDVHPPQARRRTHQLRAPGPRARAPRDLRGDGLPRRRHGGGPALAGFSPAEADVLRYAIGKKIRDRLQSSSAPSSLRDVSIAAFKARLRAIFDQFETVLPDYGFNRAHAACYGLIAYYTAYLKANYPAEYMAAVLSSDAGDTEKNLPQPSLNVSAWASPFCRRSKQSFENFTVTGRGYPVRPGRRARTSGWGPVEAFWLAR